MVEDCDEDWGQLRFREGDVLGERLPDDLVLKDTRFSTPFFHSLKEGPFALADQVLNEIEPFDGFNRIDEEFRGWVQKIIFHVYSVNRELGLRDFNESELRILIWEMWFVDSCHGVPHFGQKMRDDGSSYSRSHLFNALLNGITLTGITDLAFLLALLHHDDFEDLDFHKPEPNKSLLTALSACKLKFPHTEFDSNKQGQMLSRLFAIVAGVSNLKTSPEALLSSSDKELNNTSALIRKMLEYEPLVMVVRACDRLHNLRTLEGMRKNGKTKSANGKISESLERLAPIVLSLGLRDLYKAMVQACFVDSNPSALSDFDRVQSERLKARLGEEQNFRNELDSRLRPLAEDPSVVFLGYKPKPFFEPEYADREKIFDQEYRPSEQVDPMDPLFQIEVLVEDEAQVQNVKAMMVSFLLEGPAHRVDEQRGVVHISNPRLGRRIEFRVRSVKGARVAQAGVLRKKSVIHDAPGELEVETSLPKVLAARYHRLTELLGPESSPDAARALIKELLLYSTRFALTPDLDEVELPSDAVVLDYALRIHKRVVETCEGALSYPSSTKGSGRKLKPFDRVFSGLDSSITPTVDVQRATESQVSPSWVTFTRDPYTLDAIRELLRRKSKAEKETLGRTYVRELATLLNCSPHDLERVFLRTDLGQLEDEATSSVRATTFYEEVGFHKRDPLKLLEGLTQLRTLDVEIDFPHEPDVLKNFLSRFGRSEVNLNLPEKPKNSSGNRLKVVFQFQGASGLNVSLYDLLCLAYQISRVHDLKILNKEFQDLFAPTPS